MPNPTYDPYPEDRGEDPDSTEVEPTLRPDTDDGTVDAPNTIEEARYTVSTVYARRGSREETDVEPSLVNEVQDFDCAAMLLKGEREVNADGVMVCVHERDGKRHTLIAVADAQGSTWESQSVTEIALDGVHNGFERYTDPVEIYNHVPQFVRNQASDPYYKFSGAKADRASTALTLVSLVPDEPIKVLRGGDVFCLRSGTNGNCAYRSTDNSELQVLMDDIQRVRLGEATDSQFLYLPQPAEIFTETLKDHPEAGQCDVDADLSFLTEWYNRCHQAPGIKFAKAVGGCLLSGMPRGYIGAKIDPKPEWCTVDTLPPLEAGESLLVSTDGASICPFKRDADSNLFYHPEARTADTDLARVMAEGKSAKQALGQILALRATALMRYTHLKEQGDGEQLSRIQELDNWGAVLIKGR